MLLSHGTRKCNLMYSNNAPLSVYWAISSPQVAVLQGILPRFILSLVANHQFAFVCVQTQVNFIPASVSTAAENVHCIPFVVSQ